MIIYQQSFNLKFSNDLMELSGFNSAAGFRKRRKRGASLRPLYRN